MRSVCFGYLIAAALAACAACVPPPPPPADLVFFRGAVFARERADSVAIRDARIVAVGHEATIRRYVSEKTCVIDLDGRMLLPGFTDVELHLYDGAESLSWPHIAEADSEEELLEILMAHERSLPPGVWLRGVGWRRHRVERPTRERLDAVFPDRPVALLSQDGKTQWMNSLALRAGKPPERSREERLAILDEGVRYVSRFGITAVETSGLLSETPLELYQELERRGRLPLHVYSSKSRNDRPERVRVRVRVRVHPSKISPDWTPQRARGRHTLPLRSLRDGGAKLAFGSDWPLASVDPLAGIAAAVSRRSLDRKPEHGWLPQEKLTVTEAIYAYTHRFLVEGGLADLAVVSRDLARARDEQIASAKVDMTVFAGTVVYLSESFAAQLGPNRIPTR